MRYNVVIMHLLKNTKTSKLPFANDDYFKAFKYTVYFIDVID